MQSKSWSSVRCYLEKEGSADAAVNRSSRDLNFGDVVWVRPYCSSWWLAQVVDDNSVSGRYKPRNKSAGEVLVRLYGSYKYLYVDPVMSHREFENTLELSGGSYMDILKEALNQDITCLRSGRSKRKQMESTEIARDVVSEDGLLKQNKIKSQDSTNTDSCVPSNKRSPAQNGMHKSPKSIQPENVKISAENSKLSARRKKVMQTLGLIAPSGSPFHLS